MAEENVLREGVIVHAPATADHRLAPPGHVVGEGHSRSEIVVVLLVELADRHLGLRRRVEAIEQIALLVHNTEVVPPQTQIQCQPRRPAEAVLNVKRMAVFGRVPPRIASSLPAVGGLPI